MNVRWYGLLGGIFFVALLFLIQGGLLDNIPLGADSVGGSVRDSYIYVPFDLSMKSTAHPDKIATPWGSSVMRIFRAWYERHHKEHLSYSVVPKIPHIIHQIWLGSPFPDKYRAWQESWKRLHPEWRYCLWTDADIEKLSRIPGFFVGDTYRYYQEATNFGERSDILRLLLLNYYGGLYVDTDFEALQSLAPLHHYHSFYTGMQPLDVAYPQLGLALIGATPGHPLLQELLAMIAQNRNQKSIVMRTGPLMMTRCLARQLTGESVLLHDALVLPASYFYPMGYGQLHEPPEVWQRPESFAVHHWEGSWLSPYADRRSNTK